MSHVTRAHGPLPAGLSEIELDRRAVEIARGGVAAAMGALAYAIGAAESVAVRRELEDAHELLAGALHDCIDPALHEVERREADADPAAFSRDQRRDRAAHHARVL